MRRSASRLLAFGLLVPALVGLSAPSASAIEFNAAVITKSFAPDTVALNGSSIATITVTNPNAGSLANVQFSDTMPAGIDLITQTGGTCSTPATGGGMFTINPGTDTFSSTSSVLASSQACTITVQVKGTAVGTHVNTTSPVTATNVPPGPAASATLTVTGSTTPPTCSPDCDGDGLTEAQETNGVPVNLTVRKAGGTSALTLLKSDPTKPDTDGDGLTDGQEVNGVVVNQKIKRKRGKPKTIRIARYFADPSVADTDGDGLTDGREVGGFKIGGKGFCRPDPTNFNTDFAKLSDGFEILREKAGPQNPCRPD